jgi:Ribbon-helix-helix protein
MKSDKVVQLEERTARLTLLIDPRKKAVFERLCAQEDLTPSQVVRRLIREYIEARLGRPWIPGEEQPKGDSQSPSRSTGKPKPRIPRA